jgi:hypothetical protein
MQVACHQVMVRPPASYRGGGLQLWRVAVSSRHWQPTMGAVQTEGLAGLATSYRKKRKADYEILQRASDLWWGLAKSVMNFWFQQSRDIFDPLNDH